MNTPSPHSCFAETMQPDAVIPALSPCPADFAARSPRRGSRLGFVSLAVRLLVALCCCPLLTGCFGFLKPAQTTSRQFLLTSIPSTNRSEATPAAPAVGVGQVRMAAYLLSKSIAIRDGTNEIKYLPTSLWAERVENGFQRVLATDLSLMLPSDRILFSEWRREDVSVEVYVSVERFDVDASGQAVLAAWWRILSPGGESVLKTGGSRLVRQGPPPETDPSGSVAALSGLIEDLSRTLCVEIRQAAASTNAAPVH